MKRVFVIHGWGGSPTGEWFPWIKKELEKRKLEVNVLEMPDTDCPKINAWVNTLKDAVKSIDTETYFVGHSIGCQTILRYLQKSNKQAGGIVFVAPWTILKGLEADDQEIAKPWLKTKIDFEKIKKTNTKFVAIFSDDDPFVPLENKDVFKEKLDAKIIIERNKGHFSADNNTTEVKSALDELLKLAKNH